MVQVYCDANELIEHYETVDDAVKDMLTLWHEGKGWQVFRVMDGNKLAALLWRHDNDEEAFVSRDGVVRRYRVRYLLNDEEKYVSTSIEESDNA